MNAEIRCKRIIDGKTYNTETATLLGHREASDNPFEERLFKNRNGAFFLHVFNDTGWDYETIHPLNPMAAQLWMEGHCPAEALEAEFGEMPEAGDSEARITLRIPESLRRRAATLAEARNQSLNAWILRCLESCVAGANQHGGGR